MGTMLLEKELKYWCKKNNVDKLMNDVADYAPIYGSAVIKKTKRGAQLVDLRRLINDPTVKSLQDSRFVTIEHNLTPTQLRAKEKDGWKNIEEAISKFYTNNAPDSYINAVGMNQIVSTPLIKVFERFGEVPESFLTGGTPKANEKMVRALFITVGSDYFKFGTDGQTVVDEYGLTLFKSEWKREWPFKEFHYDKTEGRWLGVGVIEDLYPIQERINELTNQKRTSMEISSMHLFQTQDRTIIKNILNDVSNGAVLLAGANGGLTPLANEERNLSAFASEEQVYQDQGKSITFSYDAIRGEALPTSTPATNAVIQDRNATSVFGFKRQNLGNMWRYFFNDEVIPQAVNDLTPEHILNYVGDPEGLSKIDGELVESLADKKAKEILLSGGIFDIEAIKQDISNQLKAKGANRFIIIKDGYYKDTEFEFDINTDNEQEDTAVAATNLFTVINAIAKNPGILQDPVMKELIYEWADKIGVSPLKLEVAAQKKEQMSQQAQGGQIPAQMSMMNQPSANNPQIMNVPQAPMN